MISYQEALQLIGQAARLQPTEMRLCTQLTGCVSAEDIAAPISIPPFDNAAMDGFALPSHKTLDASPENPLSFQVRHAIAAGEVLPDTIKDAAVEIMTGAQMPPHCDAVVPIEDVEIIADDATGRTIRIHQPLSPQENVRLQGEDFHAGHVLVRKGTRLHAGHIAALTAAGVGCATVYQMPSVAVLTTGKEVSDRYDIPLVAGEIYNSNTPYLISQLQQAGIPATAVGHIGDSPEQLAAVLTETTAQIVISTGAVSKGRWDFIPDVLQQHGAQIRFHRVAIKPGKPILFAVLTDGRYYFGLPGNPVAAAVGLRFFVQPLIRHLLGMAPEVFYQAKLQAPLEKKGPFRHFLKAHMENVHGSVQLSLLHGQESFKIAPLCAMNCWAIVEEGQNTAPQETLLRIAPLNCFPHH